MGTTTINRPVPTYLPGKLVPPRPVPGLVVRQRLLDGLTEAVRTHPLTLLIGPAGCGKTTLVSTWAAANAGVAWVLLDAGDDTPAQFWALVLGALAISDNPSCDGDPVCLLASHLDGARTSRVLVLDGVDTITNRQTLTELKALLRRLPAALRIVMISRRPTEELHLQRLQVEGIACRLDANTLRMTRAETQALLAEAGLDLDAETIAALWQRTEGWAATLRLAALALRGQPSRERVGNLTGDEYFLSDYLAEEILCNVDDEMHRFLVRTSVADELDGSLADVLTGDEGGGARLAALRAAGFPVSAVEGRPGVYRHHPLVAGMLRGQLLQESPALAAELRDRADAWYAEHRWEPRPLVADPRADRAADRRPAVAAPERLSEAELAILRYLRSPMTNLEIAGERCLSINTVKTHLKQIYRKLDADGRSDAVVRATELGLFAR